LTPVSALRGQLDAGLRASERAQSRDGFRASEGLQRRDGVRASEGDWSTDGLLASEGLQVSEHGSGLLLHDWLTALRRWCRRRAGIGLHSLVRRPGRVEATRTHLDVIFEHRQADIRVRRAGLDLDPGWVPWIGRVVRFHYVDSEPDRS
jgi:hypothetical protein